MEEMRLLDAARICGVDNDDAMVETCGLIYFLPVLILFFLSGGLVVLVAREREIERRYLPTQCMR